MANITLGSTPHKLVVVLSKGFDFFCIIRSKEEAWDPDLVMKLSYVVTDGPPIEWVATISGQDAIFNVQGEEVDALLTKQIKRVRLVIEQDDDDILWAAGRVDVKSA